MLELGFLEDLMIDGATAKKTLRSTGLQSANGVPDDTVELGSAAKGLKLFTL